MLGYIPFWAKLKPTSALAVYYLELTTAIATCRLMAAMMYNIAAKYIQDPWTVPLSPWLVLSAMSQQRPSPLMTECLSRPRVMEGPSHSILASVLRSILDMNNADCDFDDMRSIYSSVVGPSTAAVWFQLTGLGSRTTKSWMQQNNLIDSLST